MRNGAGKTTLIRIPTGREFSSAGHVAVLDASSVENEQVLGRLMFIREEHTYPRNLRVRQAVQVASWFYPNWDAGLARELLADFGLPLGRRVRNRRVRKLSRGMRSALGIVIGLAVRAEVTLFDEPLGRCDRAPGRVRLSGKGLATAARPGCHY
jgi:ABC-2 type transport system ATP-binding protein